MFYPFVFIITVIINDGNYYKYGKNSINFKLILHRHDAAFCTTYFILFVNTRKKYWNILFRNSGKTFSGLYQRVLKAIKMPLRIRKAILVHPHAKYNILYWIYANFTLYFDEIYFSKKWKINFLIRFFSEYSMFRSSLKNCFIGACKSRYY